MAGVQQTRVRSRRFRVERDDDHKTVVQFGRDVIGLIDEYADEAACSRMLAMENLICVALAFLGYNTTNLGDLADPLDRRPANRSGRSADRTVDKSVAKTADKSAAKTTAKPATKSSARSASLPTRKRGRPRKAA